MHKITKYVAYDGTIFDTLEEVDRYESTAFNRWLNERGFISFINEGDCARRGEGYETQRRARRGVIRELFEYQEGHQPGETPTMRHVLLEGGPADGVRHDGQNDFQRGDKINILIAGPGWHTYQVQEVREPCGWAIWIGAKK